MQQSAHDVTFLFPTAYFSRLLMLHSRSSPEATAGSSVIETLMIAMARFLSLAEVLVTGRSSVLIQIHQSDRSVW